MRVYLKISYFEWEILIDSDVQYIVNGLIIKVMFLLVDFFNRFVFSFSFLEISKLCLLAEKKIW